MKPKKTPTGYSLVETLVAVSILLLSIVGPMTIAAKGIQTGIFVGDQTVAIFLAQEEIESVMAVRNEYALANLGTSNVWDWTNGGPLNACFNPNGCSINWNSTGNPLYEVIACNPGNNNPCRLYFSTSTGRTRFNAESTGRQTMYTRTLHLQELSNREVIASSTVSWNSTLFGGPRSVTLRSSFFNIYDF